MQLDALTNLFGANCQWETSARTTVNKTGCWGEQIPLHEGGGQWGGANVLMCGRWLGRDNGRISQSPGWLIWDGSSEPLTMGSPIVLLLIPTSHKLQTKVNLFLKGGKNIDPCFSWGKWVKNLFARDGWLSNSPSTLPRLFFLLLAFILFICSLYCPVMVVDSGMMNDPGFSDWSGAEAPVGGLEPALRPGSLILKYTEMPSRAGLKSVWCRPGFSLWMDLCFQSLVKSLLFFFSVFSFSFFSPWKDSLTNYDSWVEGLSLFTLQRQTCESQGARNVINVSAVHLIFCLWCVKVPGFARAEKRISVMPRWWKW